MENFKARVCSAQAALKAPKGQYNSFGKYKYRSCEDILEAAKPLCTSLGLVLTITDEIVLVGERYYVKSTATLRDTESEETLSNVAYAREENEKKGMDVCQLTGATSSYARKYALNGLFCIDDTKDADTDEYARQNNKQEPKNQEYPKLTCDNCSKVIVGYTNNHGRQVSPKEHIKQTKMKFGKQYCLECARAMSAKEKEESDA